MSSIGDVEVFEKSNDATNSIDAGALDVVALEDEEGESNLRTTIASTTPKPAPPGSLLSSQSRMSFLTTACKKYEFVPFSKNGNTVFIKFSIDLEAAELGGAAPFVIKLLVEGYWTLFVYGRKVNKQHPLYPMFSCENSLAANSKNYKLDISLTEMLFAYLRDCKVCTGNPEFYELCRQGNGEGLRVLQLSDGTEVQEVVRLVKWKNRSFPSTLVHKNCQLLQSPEDSANIDVPFRCTACSRVTEELVLIAADVQPPRSRRVNGSSSPPAKRIRSISPVNIVPSAPVSISVDKVGSLAMPSGASNTTFLTPAPPAPAVPPAATPAAPVTSIPPGIAMRPTTMMDPTYLRAKNENGKYFIVRDFRGVYYCGLCPVPNRFHNQNQLVTFNEHLWMKHHVFIESLSLWCQHCRKPFFDRSRHTIHMKKEHSTMTVAV